MYTISRWRLVRVFWNVCLTGVLNSISSVSIMTKGIVSMKVIASLLNLGVVDRIRVIDFGFVDVKKIFMINRLVKLFYVYFEMVKIIISTLVRKRNLCRPKNRGGVLLFVVLAQIHLSGPYTSVDHLSLSLY